MTFTCEKLNTAERDRRDNLVNTCRGQGSAESGDDNRHDVLICTSGTQREHSSKPLKHGIVKRILVFKR